MWWTWYRRRLEVLETGGGWLVQRDGRTVALLTDPQYVDMFWCAWKIEPLSDDPGERQAVLSDDYWSPDLDGRTIYRSREFGVVSEAAFPSYTTRGRLVIRGLLQPISGPWPWDRLALWSCRLGNRPAQRS